MTYEARAQATFSGVTLAPTTWGAASFHMSTPWGNIVQNAMVEAEYALAKALLAEIHHSNVPGAVVEFGLYEGRWLEYLLIEMEKLGMERRVLGFDSFEGLPELSSADEGMGWEKGQYSAAYEQVAARLNLSGRPNLTLHRGWFKDTIGLPEAAIDRVAYARVDGDLYLSAVDSLRYLSGRLSDKSILVFDDWTFDENKGETKAFFEWASSSGYSFKCLGFFSLGRLYMRVSKK